jgi:hypothetical protein
VENQVPKMGISKSSLRKVYMDFAGYLNVYWKKDDTLLDTHPGNSPQYLIITLRRKQTSKKLNPQDTAYAQ